MKQLIFTGIAAVCLLVILIGFFVPQDRQINETFICHALDLEDPDYSKEIPVTFKGIYVDYWFRKDKFIGRINVDDPDMDFVMPEDCDEYELEIDWEETYQMVSRFTYTKGYLNNDFLGYFYGHEDLKQFHLIHCVATHVGESTTTYRARYYLNYPDKLSMDETNEIWYGTADPTLG